MIWGLVGLGLVMWAVYVLFTPPKKHKSYTLTDQNEATSRALGGSRPPDASDVVPPVSTKDDSK